MNNYSCVSCEVLHYIFVILIFDTNSILKSKNPLDSYVFVNYSIITKIQNINLKIHFFCRLNAGYP